MINAADMAALLDAYTHSRCYCQWCELIRAGEARRKATAWDDCECGRRKRSRYRVCRSCASIG